MDGAETGKKNADPAIRRRSFLGSAAGLVGVTILGPPTIPTANAAGPGGPSIPGKASERRDGRLKVTGHKVFARDFTARDVGWGPTQWYAMYLPALTTERAFLGVDLALLPARAQPARIVLGNDLGAATSPNSFNKPPFVEFDLIVRPGNVPNYLGQGVALLMFSTLASYRAARRFMQFRDAEFQLYALDNGPSSRKGQVGMGKPWSPTTTYVKYAEGADKFSFAAVDPVGYQKGVDIYRKKIDAYLAQHPEFIRQAISADTQAMDPMFMEPESGLAYFDTATSCLSILVGTQSPVADARDIHAMYDAAGSPLVLKELELHACPPGGGFGGRDRSPFSLLLALTAAWSNGVPVKLMHDRWEQFRYGLKRPGARMRGTLLADANMKLRSIDAKLDFNGGGLKNLSPYVANLAALCIGGSYEIPIADIRAQSNHSQDVIGGSQRGFGGPEAFLAIEMAIDDMAVARSWDPIKFRRENFIATSTVVGGPIDQDLRLAEMLDKAENHPLWAKRVEIKEAYAERGLAYGTGIAMSLQAYGTSGDGMVAAVTIGPDGRLTVRSDIVDMGNGSETTLGVVIGPILGANADKVEMGAYRLWEQTGLRSNRADPDVPEWNDPRWTSKGTSSSSSCLTALHHVHTVQQTAIALMETSILPAACLIWRRRGLKRDDVRWVDNALEMHADPAPPIPRAVLAQRIHQEKLPVGVLGHAFFQAAWAEARYTVGGVAMDLKLDGLLLYRPNADKPDFIERTNIKPPSLKAERYFRYVWAPCVNVVGLTVDKSNGRVQVENVLSVLNAGRIIVPELVAGQSQGGVAMAIGYTLLEDMPDGMTGPANGRWNLDRYHVPRWSDVPLLTAYQPGKRAQELIIMPETEKDGAAARGIAEAVMCSIAPAISNALRDAVGVRYNSLPITPAKILQGLGPR